MTNKGMTKGRIPLTISSYFILKQQFTTYCVSNINILYCLVFLNSVLLKIKNKKIYIYFYFALMRIRFDISLERNNVLGSSILLVDTLSCF